MIPTSLTSLFLAIALSAITMNTLLIMLALRVPKRTGDIKLVLLLAVNDMILPIVAVVFIGKNIFRNLGLKLADETCQVKGPIGYIGLHLSMMLVSIIAFTRVNRVYSISIPKFVWILLGLFSTTHCFLAIASGITSKYHLLPNGIDCAPYTLKDSLSTSLNVLFGFSLMLFLIITLVSYITLIVKMLPEDKNAIVPLENSSTDFSNDKLNFIPRSRRIKLAFRTALVCLVYFLLIVPACILLIIESLTSLNDSELVSTMIDACLNSIAVVNPIIILFAHSQIQHQLYQLFFPFN